MQPSQPQFEYTTVFRNAIAIVTGKMDRWWPAARIRVGDDRSTRKPILKILPFAQGLSMLADRLLAQTGLRVKGHPPQTQWPDDSPVVSH
jgi:hypothetical protein